MQRTAWRGFGDGDPGTFPALSADAFTFSTPPTGTWADFLTTNPASGGIEDLIAAQNARPMGSNVDPFTALQSKISAAVPAGARLPLVLASVGLLALILMPSAGGRR